MHVLTLALLFLVTYPAQTQTSQQTQSTNHAIVHRRRIVLVRKPAVAKHFPNRKTAVVTYPVISGLPPTVLRRVRSLLAFKNIFDYSLDEYRNDAWLSEFTFNVNHNANHLLDLTFTQSGIAAYPDEQSKHFLIDLRSGATVAAQDAFRAEQFETLAGLVDVRLQAEIAQRKQENARSSDIDPTQKASIDDAYAALKFETKDLENFSVSRKGITFLYDAGFPHVIEALSPQGRYLFTFAELKPYIKTDGPLGQFIR